MSRVTPARRCAYAVIRRTFEEGAYTDRALASEAEGLDPRERALAKRLAFGTVQRRLTLDHTIERLANRPVDQLDAPLLAALRLGVYELAFLESAGHAAVDQAVELVKTDASRGATGLANAVLRRAAREARGMVEALPQDTPEAAAIRHSHPGWIARTWWDLLGPADARALMAANNEPAETAIRINTLKADPAEIAKRLRGEAGAGDAAERVHGGEAARPGEVRPAGAGDAAQRLRGEAGAGEVAEAGAGRPGDVLPEGLVLAGAVDIAGSELFRAGEITPQSRASMAVGRILGPRPGERVLDLCAAPGTKATHLAALMRNEGEVVAVERNAGRARELQQNVERLGADIVTVVEGDARDGHGDGFDRVLVDPPCTGLGTLRGRPDLRWRASPESARELADLQRQILARAAQAVRPGGTVVYSVCTIDPAEGENVVADVARAMDLIPDDLQTDHPLWKHPRVDRDLLTLPHRDGTDGFFIARLERGR